MKISRVKINNILGVEHLEFEAGQITKIQGDNAVGKTSVMEAIRGTLGGGNMARLIRNGEDTAEVVIVFDNDISVTAKVGATTTRRVKAPDGYAPPGTAAQWLSKNLNPNSFNPIDFVEAEPKKRLALVLEASELELEYGDLENAAKPMELKDLFKYTAYDQMDDPLGGIEIVDKRIREYRTEVNRSAKDKRAHIRELEETLPAELPDAKGVNIAFLRDTLDELKVQETTRKATITQARNDAIRKIDLDAFEAEKKAREELAVKLQRIADHKKKLSAEVHEKELADIELVNTEVVPRITDLVSQIRHAQEMERSVVAVATTKANILKARENAAVQEEESEALTTALDRLAKLKIRVMERLPVQGLGVFDGELFWKQVRVNTLNTAELIDVAMKIAEVTVGPIQLVCLDGMERLGRKKREAFEARAAKSPCQFIVTRVVDDLPLTITDE